MKNNLTIPLLLALFLLAVLTSMTSPVNDQTPKVEDKVLKDTIIAQKTYKLYVGQRGGKYITMVSKSGKTYKKYFR